jgi:hypothetical protein
MQDFWAIIVIFITEYLIDYEEDIRAKYYDDTVMYYRTRAGNKGIGVCSRLFFERI